MPTGMASPTRLETENEIKPFSFLHTVSKNVSEQQAETEERRVWFEGRLLYMLVSWPPGAEERAGIQLRLASGEKIAPADEDSDYLFGDDLTHPFPLNKRVPKGEVVVAEFINNDTQNPHLLNVIVPIEKLGGA